MQLRRVGLDTSKTVFTVHGVDDGERVVVQRNLRRGELEGFFAKLPPTLVALEACGGSHHWGRRLTALGHEVRLIPPQYVRPFVRRSKSDRHDAAAICEAASRPGMPTVPVKTAERQAQAMVVSVRELLVRQRTQLVNALRGLAAEVGIVAAKGTGQVTGLLERIALASEVPDTAKEMLAFLGAQVAQLDARVAELECRMRALHLAHPVSRLLAGIPGVGPITAVTLALTVEPQRFATGRHLAAWLGLTPKEHSTGGKQRLGGITRAGNERLRQLLVLGATSVIRSARPGSRCSSPWLLGLLARKPRKLAAVALANKMARAIWKMMTTGEAWRQSVPAG